MATLRATNLRGRSANDAPNLPDGANITGVCTATSFAGDGSSLTGIDATTVKDSGGTTRVAGNTSGIVVTGVSTLTGNVLVDGGGSSVNLQFKDTSGAYQRLGIVKDNDKLQLGEYNNAGDTFTDILTVTGAGDNVGVGTDIPTPSSSAYNGATLHLGQPSTSASGSQLKFTTGTSGHAAADGAYLAYYSNNHLYIYNREDEGISFGTNNTERVVFDSGGNVSITGICTATSFSGDGSALTGIEAGITTTYQYAQSGVITVNLGTGQAHEITLAAGISTITVTGGEVGSSHHIIITQPSSGITTVGFSTYFLWPSGGAPNISKASANSEIDMVTFVVKQQTQTGTGVTQLLATSGLDYQ